MALRWRASSATRRVTVPLSPTVSQASSSADRAVRASPTARAARNSSACSSTSGGPAKQRRVHLEVGVLGGGAHQHHEPLLHGRQQRVLLGLVEAMDLVEEEDRPLVGGAAAVLC